MHSERSEKAIIREFWVEQTRKFLELYPDDEGPVYLTLSGAEGRDIQLLIDAGLLEVTEISAIADHDKGKVVAIESSPPAVLALQERFPGLKIVEVPFQNLVRGPAPFTWPNKVEEKLCRARVVNLDLNSSLSVQEQQGAVIFPVVAWISKLAQLHASPPRRDWTLCLTIQGEICWNASACGFVKNFLLDNFRREPRFASSCELLLGEEQFASLCSPEEIDFGTWPTASQQQLLMVFVPKLIARQAHDQGWRIVTERNLRYGGDGSAPMVTWIITFSWDQAVLSVPDANYRKALLDIFSSTGVIQPDGRIHGEIARKSE